MKIKTLILLTFSFLLLSSCRGRNREVLDEQLNQQKEVIEPQTKSVEVYTGEAITGEDAEYLTLDMPAAESIELKAVPGEGYDRPKFRMEIPVKVTKQFAGEISYLRISLELLDENKDYVTTLSLNRADKETLEAALNKGKFDVINLGFDTSVTERDYNKELDKIKYYRLKNVEISNRQSATKIKKSDTSYDDDSGDSGNASASSGSYYEEEDDDDYDYGEEKESKFSKAKKKVKETYEKAKDTYNEKYKDKVDAAKEKVKDTYNEKYKDKVDAAKEKVKDKFNELFD